MRCQCMSSDLPEVWAHLMPLCPPGRLLLPFRQRRPYRRDPRVLARRSQRQLSAPRTLATTLPHRYLLSLQLRIGEPVAYLQFQAVAQLSVRHLPLLVLHLHRRLRCLLSKQGRLRVPRTSLKSAKANMRATMILTLHLASSTKMH